MGRIPKGQEPKIKIGSFLLKKEVVELIKSKPSQTQFIEEAVIFYEKYKNYISEEAMERE